MEMPKSMRNIGKYADNEMNVMRENAHIYIFENRGICFGFKTGSRHSRSHLPFSE